MKHYIFNEQQRAATGYTDLYVVTAADLTETTNNTDQAITLDTLAFGDIVNNRASITIATAFDLAVAGETLAVSLGVTSALTQVIGASTIISSGTAVAAKTSFVPAGSTAAYPTPSGGKSLLLNFDITAASGALATHDVGELLVYANISRYAHRVGIQR